MNESKCFQRRELRRAFLIHAVAPALALLAGCAAHATTELGGDDRASGSTPELVGGQPASADTFRSTVGIADDCTAAKVGDRLFLTAAHCVALPRAGRMTVENYPPNDGIRDSYLPATPLLIHWGLDPSDPNDAARGTFTVVKTSIHPSWWACPACQEPNRSQGGAADIAVVEIAEETPQIPAARVELSKVALGTQVIKVGFGCEDRLVPGRVQKLGRYKWETATTIEASEIRRFDSPFTDEQVATTDAAYLITAGHAQDERHASLCPGDSGGPLYLAGAGDLRIVGVNSDYTFPPSETDDPGGISWTDWHTRTSLDSLHGVGQWLVDLGVDMVASAGR